MTHRRRSVGRPRQRSDADDAKYDGACLSPKLSTTHKKRRPKHILHDPDDQINTDNAPYQEIQSTSAQRLRRRKLGP
ncbi:jg3355 [Pararge aegeria aegeria]|uniref:Jg3355 protein n=1 Tax=Pararge aegeria aegeria TaxID=348720 RepID=A0A8S4S089_9NEOP|nr:jg3355 [Pararge aegeria aegeria]